MKKAMSTGEGAWLPANTVCVSCVLGRKEGLYLFGTSQTARVSRICLGLGWGLVPSPTLLTPGMLPELQLLGQGSGPGCQAEWSGVLLLPRVPKVS